MARDSDELNPSAWMLLRDARALVAEQTKSVMAAEKLLCSHLADSHIRWKYVQCSGEWQPLDPITARSSTFWRTDPPDHLDIDWDASSATRTGPANTIIKGSDDPNHPEGFRTLSAEVLQILVAMAQRGELPATNYTVNLIRLHHGDVLSMLQSAGFVVLAPPTTPAPAAPARRLSTKDWIAYMVKTPKGAGGKHSGLCSALGTASG
jgi:hypothetical protein